jgi:hypothetical protein
MKISATLKNTRGGIKTTADSDRLEISTRLGNKHLADITILPSGSIIIDESNISKVIVNKGKQQTGKPCYCSDDDMSLPHYH